MCAMKRAKDSINERAKGEISGSIRVDIGANDKRERPSDDGIALRSSRSSVLIGWRRETQPPTSTWTGVDFACLGSNLSRSINFWDGRRSNEIRSSRKSRYQRRIAARAGPTQSRSGGQRRSGRMRDCTLCHCYYTTTDHRCTDTHSTRRSHSRSFSISWLYSFFSNPHQVDRGYHRLIDQHYLIGRHTTRTDANTHKKAGKEE